MTTEQVKDNIYFLFLVAFKSINLNVSHPYIHMAMVLLPEFKKQRSEMLDAMSHLFEIIC